MKPAKPLLLCLASTMLLSCGGQPSSENSSSSELSSESSSSTESSSESSSGSESSSQASSQASSINPIAEKFATAEGFIANYVEMMGKRATKMDYYLEGYSSTEDKNPVRGSLRVDSNESLHTKTTIEGGVAQSPEITYARLNEDTYYYLNACGPIYSVGQRYHFGETDPLRPDIIAKETAEERFVYDTRENTPGKIAFYSTFSEIDERAVTISYEFELSKDGTATIDYDGVVKGSYFGSYYHAEIDLNEDGYFAGGYFKRSNYLSSAWDAEKGEKKEGAMPSSWFSTSFSSVGYEKLEEGELLDPSPYYATSGSRLAYHYYESLESGSTVERTNAKVGDYISVNQIDMGEATFVPATAIDRKTLYITGSSNEAVVGLEEAAGASYWKALAAGSTTLTLGNSFVPNVATVQLIVKR